MARHDVAGRGKLAQQAIGGGTTGGWPLRLTAGAAADGDAASDRLGKLGAARRDAVGRGRHSPQRRLRNATSLGNRRRGDGVVGC